jgi:hypothetical protein
MSSSVKKQVKEQRELQSFQDVWPLVPLQLRCRLQSRIGGSRQHDLREQVTWYLLGQLKEQTYNGRRG